MLERCGQRCVKKVYQKCSRRWWIPSTHVDVPSIGIRKTTGDGSALSARPMLDGVTVCELLSHPSCNIREHVVLTTSSQSQCLASRLYVTVVHQYHIAI